MKLTYGSGAGDLRALAADLERAPGRVGARAAQVIRSGAARITRDAKILAPVDTGNLRASIGADITGDGRTGSITAEIGPTADYGVYVELGTSRMAPQPYLFPAFDNQIDGISRALGDAVADPFKG